MENEQFQEFVVKHLMNLSDRMASVESDVKNLTSLPDRMASLENTVLRIETRMENEIIDKIKILFDGHQFHETRLDRVEKKLGLNL